MGRRACHPSPLITLCYRHAPHAAWGRTSRVSKGSTGNMQIKAIVPLSGPNPVFPSHSSDTNFYPLHLGVRKEGGCHFLPHPGPQTSLLVCQTHLIPSRGAKMVSLLRNRKFTTCLTTPRELPAVPGAALELWKVNPSQEVPTTHAAGQTHHSRCRFSSALQPQADPGSLFSACRFLPGYGSSCSLAQLH